MGVVGELGQRLVRAFSEFNKDRGSLMAAAAAYFMGLSLFPLLSVVISCVGWFLQYGDPGQNAEQRVMQTVEQHVSPVVARQVHEMLMQIQQNSATSGRLGLVMLLFTAIIGFAQFQIAFDVIWNVETPADQSWWAMIWQLVVERGIALLMLLAIGALVLTAFLAATIMAAVQARTNNILPAPDIVWTLLQAGSSLLINIAAFTLLYRWLPKARVHTLDALEGAFLVAIFWEIGRQVLATVLIGTSYSSAYGIVGTFIGLMVWCYYGCLIIFLGAEYVQERSCARLKAAGLTPAGGCH